MYTLTEKENLFTNSLPYLPDNQYSCEVPIQKTPENEIYTFTTNTNKKIPNLEQNLSLSLLVGKIYVIKLLLPVLMRSQPSLKNSSGSILGEVFFGDNVRTLTVDIVKCL